MIWMGKYEKISRMSDKALFPDLDDGYKDVWLKIIH